MTDRAKPPPPRKGLLHFVDAAGYSLQGMRRLWQETAARQEVLAGAIGAGLLVLRGASGWQVAIFVMLILALLAVEALNTALEVIVDHLSPGWSEMARDAKDLGSLAVGLTVAVTTVFLLAALIWPAGQ